MSDGPTALPDRMTLGQELMQMERATQAFVDETLIPDALIHVFLKKITHGPTGIVWDEKAGRDFIGMFRRIEDAPTAQFQNPDYYNITRKYAVFIDDNGKRVNIPIRSIDRQKTQIISLPPQIVTEEEEESQGWGLKSRLSAFVNSLRRKS